MHDELSGKVGTSHRNARAMFYNKSSTSLPFEFQENLENLCVIMKACPTLLIFTPPPGGLLGKKNYLIEVGLRYPRRTHGLVLMTPSMAWLKERRWAPYLRLIRPELGLIQVAPRPIVEAVVRRLIPGANSPAAAAGIDEFVRTYTTARGRAAFYAAARSIYLEEPHGDEGFWTQLRELAPDSLFIWGTHDRLAPTSFIKYVEHALPAAHHVELDCGHIPQIERPREAHAAIAEFLADLG